MPRIFFIAIAVSIASKKRFIISVLSGEFILTVFFFWNSLFLHFIMIYSPDEAALKIVIATIPNIDIQIVLPTLKRLCTSVFVL